MKGMLTVILILGLSLSVFADDQKSESRSKNDNHRVESRQDISHRESPRRDEPRHDEYRNGRHYGYYHTQSGALVWGLVGVVTASEIIEAVSEPRQRVVYVQQLVVTPAPTAVYVQPQVVVQPQPLYIQQLPVVVRDQPLFYYPDGRLVR